MSSQDSQLFHWRFSTELNNNEFEIHGSVLFFIIILFAAVIFITLLSLFVRRICHYQRRHSPSIPPTHPLQSQPGGLCLAIIKTIPITLHQSSPSSGLGHSTECCICLGGFEDGDKVKVLPECNHCFHSECVAKWLIARSSCPLCRTSLYHNRLNI